MTKDNLFRPDWTPLTIGLMVLGFVVFWPLGLAMLGYILWGDRLHRQWDEKAGMFANRGACRRFRGPERHAYRGATGNVAFDDFRAREITRLEEERRKLDEMRQDFDDYLRDLRRAKDQEEFDRYMRQRTSRERAELNETTGGASPPDTQGAPA